MIQWIYTLRKWKQNKTTKHKSHGLLTQHTANLIRSQIRNTLIKIQMFFTETSRKKGHTGDDTTKVIRIHLLGLIPYYLKLIISTPYSKATPRDRIISFLHMHYPIVRKTVTKVPPIHKKNQIFHSAWCKPAEVLKTKCYETASKPCKDGTDPF